MPFQSNQQRKYMYANHPKIAKRWSDKYENKDKDNNRKQKAIEKRVNKDGKHNS